MSSSSTSSSLEAGTSPEQLCYIPCSFCNIVLAVSVPCRNLFDLVTVRCGHCTNIWSVNMAGAMTATGSFQHSLTNSISQQHSSSSSSPHHDDHHHNHHHNHHQDTNDTPNTRVDLGSSSKYMPHPPPMMNDQKTINPPPEKRTRVPSAYNHFIKQEIQRIKANEPNMSHREAFSAAAKNWAHFPHINFGLMLEANNHDQEERDELSYVQGSKKRSKSRPKSLH